MIWVIIYLLVGLLGSLYLVGAAWLLSCKFGFGTKPPKFPWITFFKGRCIMALFCLYGFLQLAKVLKG